MFFLISARSTAGASSSKDISQETVMSEGMEITVFNKAGVLSIRAAKGFERSYTWEGATRTLLLIPKKERWNGKLGIGSSYDSFQNHNTITKANIEEAQWNFESLEDALAVLRHRSRMDGNTIYNDQGLMVSWEKAIHPDPERKSGNVLLVTVYQIYINGLIPTQLPGSQNKKIIIKFN